MLELLEDNMAGELRCDVIYVGDGISGGSESYKNILSHRHTFTLSDRKNFVASGGSVEFYTTQDRVRFRVNQCALDAKAYVIGSRLLDFAR